MSKNNLFHLFEQEFQKNLSKDAFLKLDGSNITYEEVLKKSSQIANLLVREGGTLGDRVAVQVDKTVEAVLLYLGCLKAGLVYLPLNTAYKTGEVDYFLTDATPAFLICDPAKEADLTPVAKKAGVKKIFNMDAQGTGSLIDAAMTEEDTFVTVPRKSDDLAAILYTSGTTGRSKGAMLTHENLASNAQTLVKYWAFEEDDILLHALPIFHVHGLFVALHCAFLKANTVIFLPKFDVNAVMANLPKSTVFMGVPTFYVRMLDNPEFGKETCQNMRLFTAGSAPLLEETFNLFTERTGHVILERYGMSEAGMITSNPYEGKRIAGSVGFPLDNEVRIADEEGNILPDGEIGILEIKGPNVFKGYWKMPEKTAAEFRSDGFFITGDMTMKGDDGYYRIVGRSKDLIISGGYNVYPKEIESYLDEMEGVLESAVVGQPDPDFGEAVVAFIVLDNSKEITPEDVITYAKKNLANFKAPKEVIFLEELPRNTMGKVQKNELRKITAK